jgi:hypothetical protein
VSRAHVPAAARKDVQKFYDQVRDQHIIDSEAWWEVRSYYSSWFTHHAAQGEIRQDLLDRYRAADEGFNKVCRDNRRRRQLEAAA